MMNILSKYTQSQYTSAAVWKLLSVLPVTVVPLIIDLVLKDNNPFLFNAGIAAGSFIGLTVFITVCHSNLILKPIILKQVISKAFNYKKGWDRSINISERRENRRLLTAISLGAVAQLAYAFFAWSTQFTDTVITTIIFGTAPLLGILFMNRIILNPDRTHRYRKITKKTRVLLFVSFVGFGFIIYGNIGYPETGNTFSLYSQLLGILLAGIAAAIAALNAYGFRWGVKLHEGMPSSQVADDKQGTMLLACVILGWALSSLISIPVSIVGAVITDGGITFKAFGYAIGVGCMLLAPSIICYRKALLIAGELSFMAI